MMSLHADAIRALSDWSAPDTHQLDLQQAYLDHLGAHPNAMLRTCHPDHLTASALIVDAASQRVALTLHAKLGLWLQTGGHCEPGDTTLASAALREATEESGLIGLTVHPVPVRLDRHEVPCGPAELLAERPAHHLDVQFLALTGSTTDLVMSDESHDLRWFDTNTLPAETDGSVRRLVADCLALL